jgi:hypothetical protein
MAIGSVHDTRYGEAWDALTALVAAEGSASVPVARALSSVHAPARDLADAVHCLCLLHGRHPGVIDAVSDRTQHPAASAWLAEAADAFAEERATLVRLVAAVGPLPSTPGQAESEAAILGQRHALDMLAASDRAGCPIGATMALLLDWHAIRAVLDTTAERLGLAIEPSQLPAYQESATVLAALAETPAFERAMLFGAQQVLAQHRAMWHLLEARATARDDG